MSTVPRCRCPVADVLPARNGSVNDQPGRLQWVSAQPSTSSSASRRPHRQWLAGDLEDAEEPCGRLHGQPFLSGALHGLNTRCHKATECAAATVTEAVKKPGRIIRLSDPRPSPDRRLPEQDATVLCPRRSYHTETIEFSVSHSSEERVPFARGKSENRTFGVLAVANTDLASRQARHLDAVAVGETQGTLNPVRI